MKPSSDLSKYHLHKKAPAKRQFELFDLEEYVSKNKDHSSRPHSHSYYQIIWFYNDEGSHFVDFKSYSIKKNKIFFIAKGQIHYFEKRSDYQGVLLHFNESFLLQNKEDIGFFIDYTVFNNLEVPFFQIPAALVDELKVYLKQISKEVDNVYAFGHRSILSNVLKSFLITIERERRKDVQEDGPFESSLFLLRFRKLLELAYNRHWPVARYAEELNVSTKTLNNLIKSKTGKTTSKMINDRVVLEAKRKLCHSSAFVNEIGHDLGFDDPSYFVKFFKRHVTLTPSEFRKSHA